VDATVFLERDHDAVRALFARLPETSGAVRAGFPTPFRQHGGVHELPGTRQFAV
jgi:hypothetical protein